MHQARNELAISAYDGGLDSVTRVDIPVAIEVFQRAKVFTLVLDEEPADGLPEAIPDADETEQERLQRSQHFARVGIWDLKTGELLLRVRSQAAGELRDVGARRGGVAVQAARQRQANSCALALDVKRRAQTLQGAPPPAEASAGGEVDQAAAPEAQPTAQP